MKQKASVVAQKLLNLYRQEHVIVGGWATVNPVLINEADADVIKELREMPTGKNLIRHIENLKSGKTPMDSIDADLIPYGGLMQQTNITNIILSKNEMAELERALAHFTPDEAGLDMISKLTSVRRFGEEWQTAIGATLKSNPQMARQWEVVVQTARAYQLWETATEILTQPQDDRARAQIQADMPEYETYLPMFGDMGNQLLGRLRLFISTAQPEQN
ncbi:MAG: hypothetical protein J6S06_00220 [Alphaproteobacteria bacterium]|nr:hypothetical protein [Alphaproteobacteria bacterium]